MSEPHCIPHVGTPQYRMIAKVIGLINFALRTSHSMQQVIQRRNFIRIVNFIV